MKEIERFIYEVGSHQSKYAMQESYSAALALGAKFDGAENV